MTLLFRYYGVDWLIFIIVVTHLWLLGHRKRVAFLVGASGCVFGFTFGVLTESIACSCMNVVFCCLHLRAYWKWLDR